MDMFPDTAEMVNEGMTAVLNNPHMKRMMRLQLSVMLAPVVQTRMPSASSDQLAYAAVNLAEAFINANESIGV